MRAVQAVGLVVAVADRWSGVACLGDPVAVGVEVKTQRLDHALLLPYGARGELTRGIVGQRGGALSGTGDLR